MSGLRITYGRRFASDLEEMGAYLAGEAGVRTAERWITTIRIAARSLATAPGRGAADPALGGERRRLVVSPYLIIYEVRGNELIVLRGARRARPPGSARRLTGVPSAHPSR